MNDLLKVLDMSEDEQYDWLWKRHDTFGFDLKWINFDAPSAKKDIAMHLADLGFRLRDEVEMGQWPALAQAYECVRNKWCNDTWPQRHSMGLNKKHISSSLFWLFHSKPIHWIIACLIAKEKEND